MSQLMVIDGFSLAFRAFYAYPLSLTSADGQCINAIYGFFTLFLSAIDQFKPNYVVVCFDRPEPTFRHQFFSEYKAHRSPPPDEFKMQIPILKEALTQFNISILEAPGFEADDIMGTLAKRYGSDSLTVQLFTGDHDAFQLVNDYVEVIMPKKGVSNYMIYNSDKVINKYGVMPSQIVDFKALKGDSSDNIPGVKGVGDKTAAKLLNQFVSLVQLYEQIDSVSNDKLREKLLMDKHNAMISFELAKIDTNVEIDIQLDGLKLAFDWQYIQTFFKQFKFKTLLKKYEPYFEPLSSREQSSEEISFQGSLITSVQELKKIVPLLKSGFAIDLETTSLVVQEAQIVGVSLCCSDHEAYYIAMNPYLSDVSIDETVPMFSVDQTTDFISRSLNPLLNLLKPLLEDVDIPKFTHHGKYDYQVLKQYNIDLNGIVFDSMIAAFLCFPLDSVGLKDCAWRHLNIEMVSYDSLIKSMKDVSCFSDLALDQACNYACLDANVTYKLCHFFKSIVHEKGLDTLFNTIEMPLMLVLADMELEGVYVDLTKLNEIRSLFSDELMTLTQAIYKQSGQHFNINSTQQLATVLFDELQLPVIKKTKTGRSTDMSVLESLMDKHPIIDFLIKYRSLEKLLSTYVNALPQLVSPVTGKIHSHFNQTVAITGRLSSSAPNLQNIPVRTQQGKAIRSVFISSSDDHVILAVDYSQIELRLMAHLSQDPHMIDAFLAGEDIHAATAAMLFDCSIDSVLPEQRYQAKAVNFGILYGMSASSLSKSIQVSREEAQGIIDGYFERFSKIKLFIETVIKEARINRFVTTAFGRIRPLLNINSANWSQRHFEERAAVNTVLQGTAADIMKIAMNRIHQALLLSDFHARMIIQVHDELVFNVPIDELDSVRLLVVEHMQSVVQYTVPLTVDVSVGKNWLDLLSESS